MTKFLLLLVAALIYNAASSQTIVLNPVKDNTIYSQSGTRSNGAGMDFFVGRTGPSAGSAKRRALLQFSLASIPAGSVITGVSLLVSCTNEPPSSAPNPIELHRCLASWGEGTSNGSGAGANATSGDATWTCRFATGTGSCTQAWTTAGGDFSATVSSGVTVTSTGNYTFLSSPALIADVQKWVDTPAVNFGWLLRGDELTDYSARGFSSRENGATDTKLTITYSSAPCTTNTWTGAVSTAWETPGNWSCNAVPDSSTTVIITSGTVVLNSNRSVKKINLSPGVNFKVNTGFNLTVVQ